MNVDNSNKSQAGSYSTSSLSNQLKYLQSKNLITNFNAVKYGYPGQRKGQFKCDFRVVLPNGDYWIVFSPTSLTSDRLKTKQWDAENIKAIDSNVKRAYVVCPDSTSSRTNVLRYRDYIRTGQDKSFIDDILFHSEFVTLIENLGLGSSLAGRKAAKKGTNFESLLVQIFEDDQNLLRWKGNILAAGFQYHIFEKVMDKLALDPTKVKSLHGDDDIPKLPTYYYKDGLKKPGGFPKTDVCLTVKFVDGSTKDYTFSCKNTSKADVTVFQFPPKYCVELLGITEPDTEQLLCEYVKSGGPTNMPADRASLLTLRLSAYANEFNRWVLHGSDKDGSTPKQRADYIITRYQKNDSESIIVETIEECIQSQISQGKGDFGTAYGWTVTSSKKRKDGSKGEIYPAMRIKIDE